MSQTKEQLSLIVAELINRMRPDEKKALFANLDEQTLQYLQREKSLTHYRDPEVYVHVDADYLSFEIPVEKLYAFLMYLTDFLKRKAVLVRFDTNGTSQEQKVIASTLREKLESIHDILVDEAVTLEMGSSTLYSTGSGCMLLETDVSAKKKKELALETLKLCGYPVEVKSNRFSVSVINGKVKITEE